MTPDRPQSEFNMAVSYLNRLNVLFYVADESAMDLDMYTWLHALMTLFRELSTEMSDAEIEELDKKLANASNEVNGSIMASQRNGRREVKQTTYSALHKIDIELRKVLKKGGLQLKMQDEAGRALK